jgi:hypothetical protein
MANNLIIDVVMISFGCAGCGSQAGNLNSGSTPLAIISVSPSNGAVGVPLTECPTVDSSGNPVGYCGGAVSVTFNKPIEYVTGNISLKVLGTSGLLSGQMECTTPTAGATYELCGPGVATTSTLLFVSATTLTPGTVYQATLSPTTGDCCIADSSGNSLAGLPYVWLFTTTLNAADRDDRTRGRLTAGGPPFESLFTFRRAPLQIADADTRPKWKERSFFRRYATK